MNKRVWITVSCMAAALYMLALVIGQARGAGATLAGQGAQAGPQGPERKGAWVDAIVFTPQISPVVAVSQLEADELDVYAAPVNDAALYPAVQGSPHLAHSLSKGSHTELTFNPYGPTFNDGRLNPFHNYKIREAMNWLIDRQYIVREIYGGRGSPAFFPILAGFPEYERYASTCQALEAYYAYNPLQAEAVISAEMQAMSATLQGGIWYYDGQPITLTFIIRIEDERRPMGDYIAGRLEQVGFRVDRQYMNRSQASPIWVAGDPAEGLFHIYTGGWIETGVSRDEGGDFSFFYTPHDYPPPLWQVYAPSPAFDEIALKLRNTDYHDMAERRQLFTQALALSLNDTGSGSVHLWLVEPSSYTPRRDDTTISSSPAGGMAGSKAWPYVMRFNGQVGGTMRIAQQGILLDPWNPIAGSNWIYDQTPIQATQAYDFIPDPETGLAWPQRAERAEVVVRDGLPVTRTLDWVDLTFTPAITVPADAWVDWDAAHQRFITAGEKYTQALTANVKSTVYYPADLFTTVTWHDGSPLDMGDFILRVIMTFDRAKPESAIYDESTVADFEIFMSHFKGLRIVSTHPLVIETYDDLFQLDAERNLVSWWPNYGAGPAAWHNLAIGLRAEAAEELAFSSAKASSLEIEWTSYVGGPSLGILDGYLDQSLGENYIPYTPTLGLYVTPAEASTRWANLQAWYAARGNVWLGLGPFYLEQASLVSGTLTLRRFEDFPDVAGKWDRFAVAEPQVNMNFSSGAPGSYFNVLGSGFLVSQTLPVVLNGTSLGETTTSEDGLFTFTLSTASAGEGFYWVSFGDEPGLYRRFVLDAGEPLRTREGTHPTFDVPVGIAFTREIYLPLMINR